MTSIVEATVINKPVVTTLDKIDYPFDVKAAVNKDII
jgi:hypothetical protein